MPSTQEIQDKVLEVASRYIGQREIPPNKGFMDPAFEKDMLAIGWQKGWPWCASFVRLVYLTALKELGAGDGFITLIGGSLKHSAVVTYNMCRLDKHFTISLTPSPGGIIVWSTGAGHGHEGLCERLNDNPGKWMTTIEGNTNDKGSREGEVCAEKQRVYGTVDPKWKYLGCITLKGDDGIV